MNYRKRTDCKFALTIQHEKVITTVGQLFEQSNKTEIESLLAKSILLPLQYKFNKHIRVGLFKFYLVHKIKRKKNDKSYKKFCLVVHGYNNTEKSALLTQAPII